MEKLRVTYSKSKEAIYISHLDTLKVFQESLARANMPVEFSKGFNPRPELTFAHPLSVGIESTGEIVDIILFEYEEPSYFIKEMNKVLPSGITILNAEYVEISQKNIMSRVYGATYLINFIYTDEMLFGKTKKQIEDMKIEYLKKMENYLLQKNILVLKKTKDRMERIDIKTEIINYDFLLDGSLEIAVSAGSKKNLKPSFVMTGYNEYIDFDMEYEVKRSKILFV